MRSLAVPVTADRSAFSLVEIVIALGVVSFAIMGIVGLFPVAMRSAQESQNETRAAVIAQQIFSDLKSFSGTNTFLVRGPSATNSAYLITGINLAASNNYYLAYDIQGNGLSDVLNASLYTNSYTLSGAAYLASVQLSPDTPTNGICRIQATVETPAAAPSSRRQKYVFVSLLNQK